MCTWLDRIRTTVKWCMRIGSLYRITSQRHDGCRSKSDPLRAREGTCMWWRSGFLALLYYLPLAGPLLRTPASKPPNSTLRTPESDRGDVHAAGCAL